MRHPLDEVGPEPEVDLVANDRPRLVCSMEPTAYGYALNGAGHFVTLSPQSGLILQALNGHSTLMQIQERFGMASLQLVAGLLRKRLVELE